MTDPKLPVTCTGIVTPYKGNGRKLGYPTANFSVSSDLADGVYFGFAELKDYPHQPSVMFIGVPTTMGDTERRLEAHLLDIPDKDYYHLPINVTLQHFHRANQTFESIEALLATMQNDEIAMRAWLAALERVHHNP